jgi:hypothetical protein
MARTFGPKGEPSFVNVLDFLPDDQRSFFASSAWIRSHPPTSMSWDIVASIPRSLEETFILKNVLTLEDVRPSAPGRTGSC